MNTLTGEVLTLPKMSGSVSTPKSLSGNVGAKTINIGGKGDDGATFVPSVSADGIISWTNDKDLPNPEPVNIKGAKGDKGDKGDRGLQGVQGIQGERGEQGQKGEKGDRGEQGIQGVQGAKGETGAQGQKGADGTPATHRWSGTALYITSASGTSSANLKGEKGDKGADGKTPVKGTDYFTVADKAEMVKAVGEAFVGLTFDTFPAAEQINALDDGSYFATHGFYAKNDGLACTYKVSNTANALFVPWGNKYYAPVDAASGVHRDIYLEYYGVTHKTDGSNAARNSEIINAICSGLNNGFTLHFGSGHYYFTSPITISAHVSIKGVVSNALVGSAEVNFGTYLHFPNLANGEAAITFGVGVVKDLTIIGNSDVCDVSIDRTKTYTAPNSIVTLVDTATTYGIRNTGGGNTIQNVKVMNCTYGIWEETTNALVTDVYVRKCKVGISAGNDIKIHNVQAWYCMTAVELRGSLASVSNIRGDSIGKHLIECRGGKSTIVNVDGDYVLGSLIHYGGERRHIHLGQALGCMGRVATKTAFKRSDNFDLRNIADADYEYCSYISIAPNTQVFGGHIKLTNVRANVMDSPSEYVHSDAAISIGTGSTVKGVTIECNVSYDANVEYFNKNVIKSLSTYAETQNSDTEYVTDFDGRTVEDINFITPIGFIRSKRLLSALDRTLEFSEATNDEVRFTEQNLTEAQKAQTRKNIGLDNISSLEFVATIDSCTDSAKTYVLPDGRTVAFAEKPSYTNRLPISITSDGAIYNAGDTPGYKFGYLTYQGEDASASKWQITGFIRIKAGETFRMYNMRYIETDVNVIPAAQTKAQVCFFDENFVWKNTSGASPEKLPSSAWEPEYDETGNIVKLKVPTSYDASIRYMRLCARNINQDSVITVNEEMGPPKAEFGETGLRFVTDDMYKKIQALLS